MRLRLALGVTASVLLAPTAARAQDVNIPFTKTTLPSGMVVIFAEDHAVPQVAVNVAYHVGSSNEREGRTGFAHLFEHLMFMGTGRVPRGMFDAWMEAAGGKNNADTGEDLTDYYDIAPPTELPLLLWLEADRQMSLGNEIDAAKLGLQRDVVLNERRQSIENQPYGVEELTLPELLWPAGHPYHHPVIGSPADLRAASVGDVRSFFDSWYDPSNASLVVAGDFDAAQAKDLVTRYFAGIPSRGKPSVTALAGQAAPAPPSGEWKSTIASVVRKTVPDQVELTKVDIAWQSPPAFAAGDAELDLLASVLTKGKASRLYRTLVYDQKLAQSVEATEASQTLGSTFIVSVLVRPGVDPARVEKIVLDQIATLRTTPVTDEELRRARNGYEMAFADGLQSVPRRARLLNTYQSELGDPGYVQRDLDRYRKATAQDLLNTAKRVLQPNAFIVIDIVPRGKAAGGAQ
jgi:predicted Zn-dependent peptidase